MNRKQFDVKRAREFTSICVLIGMITSIYCFMVESGNPEIPGYWLLPLSYAICHFIFRKVFKYEFGMGLLIFEVIAIFRYIITPIITCAVHNYDGHMWANPSMYFQSVVYIIIELVMAYFTMYMMIPYVKKNLRYCADDIKTGKLGIIKALIIVYWVFIVTTSAQIRTMIFNFSLSSSSLVTSYNQTIFRNSIPSEYMMFYYIGLVVIYVEILKIVKERKISKGLKLVLIAIVSILYISCGWTDGNAVSRWGILIAVLTMIYVLMYFFPEKRKTIIIIGVCVVIAATLVGTMFKRISHGRDLSLWEAVMTYMTPEYMNEYFCGVHPVSNGIYVLRSVHENKFTTFLYDTVANIPRLLSSLGIKGMSSATFFGTTINHVELIVPSTAMSYYVFGEFGTWIYTTICVYFMILAQTKIACASSLYKRLMLFQIVFWCALSMAVNIQIIQTNCWKYVIGLILIIMDERISIRLRSRRSQ